MVVIGDVQNISRIVSLLPEPLLSRVGELFIFLKAASIAFIVYVVYLLVRFIVTWRTHQRIKMIEAVVFELDKKVDTLISRKSSSKKRKSSKNNLE